MNQTEIDTLTVKQITDYIKRNDHLIDAFGDLTSTLYDVKTAVTAHRDNTKLRKTLKFLTSNRYKVAQATGLKLHAVTSEMIKNLTK